MTNSHATFDCNIVAIDGQQLSIRASKKSVVGGMLLGIIFVIVAVGMAYKMLTVSSTNWTPSWEKPGPAYPLAQHALGGRVATYSFIFLFWGCFFVGGCTAAVVSVRKVLRSWLFDKDAGMATFGKQNWPLGDIRALRLKVDTILGSPIGVSLMMELATGTKVRIARGMVRKGTTSANLQERVVPVAQQIADWLAVPLKFG